MGPELARAAPPDVGRLALAEAASVALENEGLQLLGPDPRAAALVFGRAIRGWSGLGTTAWQARAEAFRAAALERAGRSSASRVARRRAAALLSTVGSPAGNLAGHPGPSGFPDRPA